VVERRIDINEVTDAATNGTLKEVFASGTAAVVSPVGHMHYKGKEYAINGGKTGSLAEKLFNEILDLQYGVSPDPFGWRIKVA